MAINNIYLLFFSLCSTCIYLHIAKKVLLKLRVKMEQRKLGARGGSGPKK